MKQVLKLYIITEVFDREGKLVSRRRRSSESFVKAFLGILLAQMDNTTNQTLADLDGVNRSVNEHADSFNANAAIGEVGTGIVVGTDATAVVATDFALVARIEHGITTGKLTYAAQVFLALSVADPYVSLLLQRDFTNSSGATITVKEFGVYVVARYDTTATHFCIIRDIYSAGLAVLDGYNLRVTYELKTGT